jgi:aryl-alcohol dehydrogenase-like predicted oxidoreductase
MAYTASPDRFEGKMQYRRTGRSGLDLPLLSLGYWHNFGLAQLALAWGLRDERVTSFVIGASSADQLEQNVAALDNLSLAADELAELDRHVTADGSVDVWREAREGTP